MRFKMFLMQLEANTSRLQQHRLNSRKDTNKYCLRPSISGFPLTQSVLHLYLHSPQSALKTRISSLQFLYR